MKDRLGESCKDGSDMYRPIVKAEAHGHQPSHIEVWKTWPVSEETYNRYYKGKRKEWTNYTKDDSTGLWVIPESDPFKVPSVTQEDIEKGPKLRYEWSGERKKEWADFYSNDSYIRDKETNLMMAPTTQETCEAKNGFVCKVRR